MNDASLNEAIARQRAIHEKLLAESPDGIKTAAGVRGLVEALWATAHNEGLERQDMLFSLSLLAGMATAALHDYAKLLDEKEKNDGND